jgi:hypothetical protein
LQYLLLSAGQCGEQVVIDSELISCGVLATERQTTLHLAALQACDDRFPEHGFEIAEIINHSKLEIEKPRIHAPQFQSNGARRAVARANAIAGHAADSQSWFLLGIQTRIQNFTKSQ